MVGPPPRGGGLVSMYGTDYADVPNVDPWAPPEELSEEPSRTWRPVDLSEVLAGTWTPP